MVRVKCTAEEGGIFCAIHCLPPGYAFFYGDQVSFVNDIIDVRPVSSEALKSWLLVAVKTISRGSRSSLRPIASIEYAGLDLVADAPRGQKLTYLVRSDVEGVVWSSGKWRSGGIIKEAYFHAHRSVVHDIWFFEGGPTSVFQDLSAAQASRLTILYGSGVIDAMMENIRQRQNAIFPAERTCTLVSSAFETSDLAPGWFARHSFCQINAFLQNYTIVAFFKNSGTSRNSDSNIIPPLIETHALIRVLYEVQDILIHPGNPSELAEALSDQQHR